MEEKGYWVLCRGLLRRVKESSQEMTVCLPLEMQKGGRSMCQRQHPMYLKPQVMRRP